MDHLSLSMSKYICLLTIVNVIWQFKLTVCLWQCQQNEKFVIFLNIFSITPKSCNMHVKILRSFTVRFELTSIILKNELIPKIKWTYFDDILIFVFKVQSIYPLYSVPIQSYCYDIEIYNMCETTIPPILKLATLAKAP